MISDKTPTAKVAAGGLTGFSAATLVAVAAEWGLEIPPVTAALLVAGLAFAASWLKRPRGVDIDS